MAVRNYSQNSNNPFSDNDDDMTSAFMNSSSATYLAADRLGPSYQEERNISEAEQKRNDLLQQLRQTEQKTLDSSKRSLGMLIESEKVGIETAEDLSRQKEQLQNTEKRLEDINSTLKDSQKNINGIKSVFSSLRQWWKAPKQTGEAADKDSSKSDPTSSLSSPSDQSKPVITSNLSSAVENSELSLKFSNYNPALSLRGLDGDNRDDALASSDFRTRARKVDSQLDGDLMAMSSGLSRLKNLAQGMGTEIQDQNSMLERIHTKADHADIKIGHQNTQIQKILKK